MFIQVTDSARKFVREIKDNEVFRLVRSEVQFKKFAEADKIELKTARGNQEGEFKKRIAVWSAKAEHGIIANLKDYKKFEKFCEENVVKVPTKLGRKTSEPTETPKTRGPRAIKENNTTAKKIVEPKQISTTVEEPVLELDVAADYSEKHNDKEFKSALKSEFKRLNVVADAEEVLSALKTSQNIRDLLLYAFGVYQLTYSLPENIKPSKRG